MYKLMNFVEQYESAWNQLLDHFKDNKDYPSGVIETNYDLSVIGVYDKKAGALNLGVGARLAILHELTGWQYSNFFKQLTKETRSRPLRPYPEKDHQILNLRTGQARGFERAAKISAIDQMAVAYLNEAHPDKLEEMRPGTFFSQPFTGRTAFNDFRDWIQFEEQRRQLFEVKTSFELNHTGARQSQMQEIEDWIFYDDLGLDDITRNVYERGMWKGLSAFGQKLAQSFDERSRETRDPRRCLYLPLGHLGERIKGGLRPAAGGMPEILAILRHFYTDRLDTIENYTPIRPDENLLDVQHQIRMGMIRNPRVLIVDGVYFPSDGSPLQTLERFTGGNTILGLLTRLLDLPVAALQPGTKDGKKTDIDDLKHFCRNRILVLSNADLSENTNKSGTGIKAPRWPLPYAPNGPKSSQLVAPSDKDACTIVLGHGFKKIEDIKSLRTDLGKQARKHLADTEYFAMEAAYSALDYHNRRAERDHNNPKSQLQERLTENWQNGTPESFLNTILKSVVESFDQEDKALLNWLLFFISIAPEGMRPDTILRLVRNICQTETTTQVQFKQAIDAYRPLNMADWRASLSMEERINLALENLEAVLEFILVREGGDDVPGYDDAPFGLELRLYDLLDGSNPISASIPRTITFVFPEFRVELRELLAANFELEHFQIITRYLAFEALAQQAIAMRHNGVQENQLLRPWRRQLSAILFGLQSLPIVESKSGASIEISDRYDSYTLDQPSQYQTSKTMWRWLYLFAYRRQIERPPAYNLSRLYGMHSLKLSLLSAFDNPEILLPRCLQSDAISNQARRTGLFVGEYIPEHGMRFAKATETGSDRTPALQEPFDLESKQHRQVLMSHLGSSFHASLALGSTFKAHQVLRKLKLLARGHVSPELTAIKRSMEVAILEHAPAKETFRYLRSCCDADENADPLTLLLGSETCKPLLADLRMIAKRNAMYALGQKPPEDMLVKNPRLTARDLLKGLKRAPEGIRYAEHLSKGEGVSTLADILFRIGERLAVNAETAGPLPTGHAQRAVDNVSKSIDKIDVCLFSREVDPDTALAGWCLASAIFEVAEEVRLRSYSEQPTAASYFASGHAVRQMARTNLKLANYQLSQGNGEGVTVFARQARYCALTLSRHLFRYPYERSAMLVLEAATLRLLHRNGETRGDALGISRRYLERAEPSLNGLGFKTRWRLRLALERGKLHRGIVNALLQEKDLDNTKIAFYMDLVVIDALFIYRQTETVHTFTMWTHIASEQVARAQALANLVKTDTELTRALKEIKLDNR